MGAPVTSIVPVGFDAYVRVFHPVPAQGSAEDVTWRRVADWSGRTFHPLAQFVRLSSPTLPSPGPPPFEEPPQTGTLMPAVCHVLVRQLAGLTETPSKCHFAIWEGWGYLAGGTSRVVGVKGSNPEPDALESELAAFQRQVARLPRFEHPYRRYLLGRGPIGIACDLYHQPLGPDPWPTLGLSPQLWWPEDRTWVVATEIDFDSTIVATTKSGAAALLTSEGIEALLVPSDGRLDIAGDIINPS